MSKANPNHTVPLAQAIQLMAKVFFPNPTLPAPFVLAFNFSQHQQITCVWNAHGKKPTTSCSQEVVGFVVDFKTYDS